MKRSLVVTTAFGYTSDAVRPLAYSIHKNCPNTDLLIQTSGKDLSKLIDLQDDLPNVRFCIIKDSPQIIKGRLALARKAVKHSMRRLRKTLQNLGCSDKIYIEERRLFQVSTSQCHFLIRRFFWARSTILEPRNADYANIMLCDCRDVIVQKNPFTNAQNKLITGAEVNNIGACSMNSRWILQAYDQPTLDNIAAHKILCAGVTLGSRDKILQYLNLFCDETTEVIRRKRTGFLPNLDQAIHNNALRKTEELEICESSHDGLIATIGCADEGLISISPANIVTINNCLPSIIHQYDRIPWLNKRIRETYGKREANACE